MEESLDKKLQITEFQTVQRYSERKDQRTASITNIKGYSTYTHRMSHLHQQPSFPVNA